MIISWSSVANSLDHGVGSLLSPLSRFTKSLPWVMPPYHLCACCDGSFDEATGEAGIGVSVELVNCENMSETHPFLYAWTKQPATSSHIAERKAIWFACSCLLQRDEVAREIEKIGAAGAIKSGAVLNDCQTVVQMVSCSRDFGKAQEIFKQKYDGDLSIIWESNHRHRKDSCIGVVDEMAKAARSELQRDETVYAQNANGLRDRNYRATETRACADVAQRRDSARIAPEFADMTATSNNVDRHWAGRGRSIRPQLFERNSETGAFRKAHVGVPARTESQSQSSALDASEGGPFDVHASS